MSTWLYTSGTITTTYDSSHNTYYEKKVTIKMKELKTDWFDAVYDNDSKKENDKEIGMEDYI